MRKSSLVLLSAVLALGADLLAQGGGGGRRQRPDEILNRVGAWFSDTHGPVTAGDATIDLGSAEFVRAAAGAGHPSVLFLMNGNDDQDVRDQFERQLFTDEIGINLRPFACGVIDLAKEQTLATKYGKQVPLFVVFDKDGKAGEPISMSGYKPGGNALQAALTKAAQGVVKPSLAAFTKEYADLVRDLDQLLAKKKLAKERLAKAGADKGKRAEAEKDFAATEKEEQKLLEQEKQMFAKTSVPARPDDARRLGANMPGFGRGGGGDRGGRGGGNGGAGGGNGGGEGRRGG